MKIGKKLFLVSLAVVGVTLCSCGKSSSTAIKSEDGKEKIDLVGTWTSDEGRYTFRMVFGEDKSFKYGCGGGRSGGPMQLSVGKGGGVHTEIDFNQWWESGTFKTSKNVLIATVKDYKVYTDGNLNINKGDHENFVITIVDNNEIVVQNSRTGSVRTYKRKKD